TLANCIPVRLEKSAGQVGSWVADSLFSAVLKADAPVDTIDAAVLTAFVTPIKFQQTRLTWEGLEYVIDETSAAAKDIRVLGDTPGGMRLSTLTAINAVRTELETGVKTLDDVKRIRETLSVLEPVFGTKDQGAVPAITLQHVIANLQRITKASDIKKA